MIYIAMINLLLAGMLLQIAIMYFIEKERASITIFYFTLGVLNAVVGYNQIMKLVGIN
jgi:hypothetical protein